MIVVDVETTGVDPKRYSIVSVGAVDFKKPERRFYGECKIWDGADISEEALRVNGFTKEEVERSDKKPLELLMYEFKAWLDEGDDLTLAGQNPAFDRDFLNDSFHRANIDFKFAARNVDLHSVAYVDHVRRGVVVPVKNKHSNLSLDEIAKYVGLQEEPRPHNALVGAQFEAEAFSRILHGKKLLPEFKKFEIPAYLVI